MADMTSPCSITTHERSRSSWSAWHRRRRTLPPTNGGHSSAFEPSCSSLRVRRARRQPAIRSLESCQGRRSLRPAPKTEEDPEDNGRLGETGPAIRSGSMPSCSPESARRATSSARSLPNEAVAKEERRRHPPRGGRWRCAIARARRFRYPSVRTVLSPAMTGEGLARPGWPVNASFRGARRSAACPLPPRLPALGPCPRA